MSETTHPDYEDDFWTAMQSPNAFRILPPGMIMLPVTNDKPDIPTAETVVSLFKDDESQRMALINALLAREKPVRMKATKTSLSSPLTLIHMLALGWVKETTNATASTIANK